MERKERRVMHMNTTWGRHRCITRTKQVKQQEGEELICNKNVMKPENVRLWAEYMREDEGV